MPQPEESVARLALRVDALIAATESALIAYSFLVLRERIFLVPEAQIWDPRSQEWTTI